MGILLIRELARIPARDPAGDPAGDSGLPSPRLTGPVIKSNGKSNPALLLPLLFASARRTRALCSSGVPFIAAAAVGACFLLVTSLCTSKEK